MGLVAFLEKRRKPFWVSVGLILVLVLGVVDYRTGFELSISLFYLIPIFLVAWFTDRNLTLIISAVSVIIWFLTDYVTGLTYSNPMIYVWNTMIRLGIFIIFSLLLARLRSVLKANQEMARVDYVSGAANIRYFYELAQIEISRYQRYKHPLTLVYIDLDDFKGINDSLGHNTGDKVLRAVTDGIKCQIRPTDILARLGGDEFALLLPETGEEDVKQAVGRIHSTLMEEMAKNNWSVTFSIGVVTFQQVPASVDEMIKLADGVMYSVKTDTKNGIQYHIHSG